MLYITTMYVYIYTCNIKRSKTIATLFENSCNKRRSKRSMVSSVTSALILLPFLSVALHELGRLFKGWRLSY